jgi:hypothetical protein
VVEIFLEAGEVDVEGEDLGSEGMMGSELLGAMDPLLPGSLCHRAIIGLAPAAGQIPKSFHHRVTETQRKPKKNEKPRKNKKKKVFSVSL